MNDKPPIINCHVHIFTGGHVPPYLAKTFLPWPFYYLLSLSFVVRFFQFWYKYPHSWIFKPWYKKIIENIYKTKMFIARTGLLRILGFLIGIVLTILVFFILYDLLSLIKKPNHSIDINVIKLKDWLLNYHLIFIPSSFGWRLLIILILFLFFKLGRNIVWFILKKIWSFLGIFPGSQSKELAKRYLNIGRFAFYKQQSSVFGRLRNQYPKRTGFVILPMDMEYMGAGQLKKDYLYNKQIQDLVAIKIKKEFQDCFYPFLFADPRRIIEEGKSHFNYKINNEKIELEDCFIKKHIEDYKFSGFKIYPPLGYYPFDEALLPLWKYTADQGIPIIAHCIRGTIYYRGKKKKEWDRHPIFEQVKGEKVYEPLALIEIKNKDFINNFTHPLNYLCLLEEQLLRKLVGKAKSNTIREIFGYTDEKTALKNNLSHLKLCFGHFGGDDEWRRFIELDRDNFSSQLVKNPAKGISFLSENPDKPTRGKLEQIWKYADWYSIICSLMLQYPNVYADLSFILHNSAIKPLLKQTLMNSKLCTRVLFGTDFYVVRNHKSDKNILADITDYLSEHEFDQVARVNPRDFLNNKLHGPLRV